jgi:enoyl-CoA hydratase
MTYRCFDVSIADKIAHVKFKRPDEFNSMVPEFWRELPEIIGGIDRDASARVIVLSSTGKHFCAGMDLSVFQGGQSAGTAASKATAERGRAREQMRDHLLGLQETFNVIERARMPVLSAVQGGCVGAGVDMIAATDCRYATADAFFVIQEINLAIAADVGTFPRLTKLLSDGMVREMAYTGRRLPAARAKEFGLVNEVFADQETMLKHVMDVARDIAEKSPLAIVSSKAFLNYGRDHTVADTLDYVATWQAAMYYPEVDLVEAFKAQKEKRKPVFEDMLPKKKPML